MIAEFLERVSSGVKSALGDIPAMEWNRFIDLFKREDGEPKSQSGPAPESVSRLESDDFSIEK